MNRRTVVANGEYLGYCNEKKAFIYSIAVGPAREDIQTYAIYAVTFNSYYKLITFNGLPVTHSRHTSPYRS